MFSKNGILVVFTLIKLIIIGFFAFVGVILFQSAVAEQGFMRVFQFSLLGLLGCMVFVIAHLRAPDSPCPYRNARVPCGHLVHFYGDQEMEEGHAGPIWFLTLMKQIYDHPWFSWGAVGIVLLTTAAFFYATSY